MTQVSWCEQQTNVLVNVLLRCCAGKIGHCKTLNKLHFNIAWSTNMVLVYLCALTLRCNVSCDMLAIHCVICLLLSEMYLLQSHLLLAARQQRNTCPRTATRKPSVFVKQRRVKMRETEKSRVGWNAGEREVCERVCSRTFSLVPADRCIQTLEERQRWRNVPCSEEGAPVRIFWPGTLWISQALVLGGMRSRDNSSS